MIYSDSNCYRFVSDICSAALPNARAFSNVAGALIFAASSRASGATGEYAWDKGGCRPKSFRDTPRDTEEARSADEG